MSSLSLKDVRDVRGNPSTQDVIAILVDDKNEPAGIAGLVLQPAHQSVATVFFQRRACLDQRVASLKIIEGGLRALCIPDARE
jgi:hypothetical protein